MSFTARADGEEVLLCGCKQSRDAPYCDGSHNGLDDSYDEASALERAATAHITPTPFDGGSSGKAVLDGGCYVRRLSENDFTPLGSWRVAEAISGKDGAKKLGQWMLAATGTAEPITFGDSAVALFVSHGSGSVVIAGERFAIVPETGLYVAPNEAFSVDSDTEVRLIAAVCPTGPAPRPANGTSAFTEGLPPRATTASEDARTAMADRFYQVLVGDEEGEGPIDVTQFIGEIPCSRAAPHRHMYEEAITILAGEGYMWTEGARAAVGPGDVIFLPKKQLHSLECTSEGGMRLMGAFYPSGSPAINY